MADENEITGITSHRHIIIDQLDLSNQQHVVAPGIYTQDNFTQQQIDDWLRNMQNTGIGPIYPTQIDPTYDRLSQITEEINNLKQAKDRKAECLHMLTDIFFNKQKGLTFEECQNLLGMIHSMDEENLVMAEIILKNKSYGSSSSGNTGLSR